VAATKVQSAFRGFHVRRALHAALESARYIDDDIEALEGVDVDSFLALPLDEDLELGGGRSDRAAAGQRGAYARRHTMPTPPSSPPPAVLSPNRRRQVSAGARLFVDDAMVARNDGFEEMKRGHSMHGQHGCASPAAQSEPAIRSSRVPRQPGKEEVQVLKDWGVQVSVGGNQVDQGWRSRTA
jgi:hypothetical protein